MADLICPDCGTSNTGRAEFCSSCGAFLAWDGVPDEPPAPAAAPPPMAAAPPTSAAGAGYAPPPAAGPRPQQMAPGPSGPPPASDGFSYTIKAPAGRTVSLQPAGPDSGWPGPGQPAMGPGAVATAPVPGTCPRCGTDNPATLRFCRKCGYQLFTPDPRATPAVKPTRPPKRPWWQRWIPRRWLPDSEFVDSAARRAFRRSLPMSFRLRRGVGIVGVLALIVGIFYLAGTNPVRWVKDRIEDMKGSLTPVTELQVASEPAEAQIVESPVEFLTDKSESAWATAWKPSPLGTCLAPGIAAPADSMGSLVLNMPGPTTVRELRIVAGLPAEDERRAHEYRPKTLELTFSDGKCSTVVLNDVADTQNVPIDPVTTEQIRIAFVDGYPPVADSPTNLMSMREIQALARP